jgi:hypothetical protein
MFSTDEHAIVSVGPRRDSYDNARVETVLGLYTRRM